MRTVSDYLFQRASKNRIPLEGTFELSPVCNFSCGMCYIRRTAKELEREGKKLITWKQWLGLAKECKKEGMLYLLLTGGEPFLYPNFRELYRRIHEMGIVIKINTNGTMIDYETVEWLKEAAPGRINITLYGTSPETYRKVCGRADGYERAKNAILMLKQAGIPVVINASMIPENAPDMERIIAFGREQEIHVRMSTYMFPPVRRGCPDADARFTPEQAAQMYLRKCRCMLEGEQYGKMLERHLNKIEQCFASEESGENAYEYMRCRAGRSTFWVSWEGVMTACGMFPFPVEKHPFEEPFADCWREITDKVRTTKVMQACRDCKMTELCHPCAAQLYSETGGVDDCPPYMREMTEKIIGKMKLEQERMKGK